MQADNGKKLALKIRIHVEPGNGQFHAWCPALKGLHVPGATRQEAIENARETARLYIKSLIEDGEPIPVGLLEQEPCPRVHFPRIPFRHHKEAQLEDVELVV